MARGGTARPRGLIPSRGRENWLAAPDTSPFRFSRSSRMKRSPAQSAGSWPTFSPASLSVRLHRHLFISIHASVQSVRLRVFSVICASFIHKTSNGRRYTLLFSLYPSPLTSCVPVVLLQIFKSSFIFHTQETTFTKFFLFVIFYSKKVKNMDVYVTG